MLPGLEGVAGDGGVAAARSDDVRDLDRRVAQKLPVVGRPAALLALSHFAGLVGSAGEDADDFRVENFPQGAEMLIGNGAAADDGDAAGFHERPEETKGDKEIEEIRRSETIPILITISPRCPDPLLVLSWVIEGGSSGRRGSARSPASACRPAACSGSPAYRGPGSRPSPARGSGRAAGAFPGRSGRRRPFRRPPRRNP